MRDKLRIARVMAKVTLIWSKYPDLRFFQLVESLKKDAGLQNKDPFYFEDTDFEKVLDKEIGALIITNE